MNADQGDAGQLQECPDCGRKFNPDALEKHTRVCKKVCVSKRKVFDSKEQREVEGAPAAAPSRAPHGGKRINPAIPPKGSKEGKASKWKMQSEQFRANLRSAKLAEEGGEAYEQAAKQATAYNAQDLTPCPHCGRTFNDEAANRHIPICARKAKEAQFKKGGRKK